MVACRVAQAMRRDGVAAGDRVAFLDRNGIAYFDFLFGGALIGAVNVAVNWRLSPAEMAAIIQDSGAQLLAVHTDYLPALQDMPNLPDVRQIVVFGDGPAGSDPRAVRFDEWIAGCPSEDPGHEGSPDEISMQLYTSGTTGLPKGVMLTNANLSTALSEAGHTFSIARRHREPGCHAALPHRRIGLGSLCHVSRRPLHHPS